MAVVAFLTMGLVVSTSGASAQSSTDGHWVDLFAPPNNLDGGVSDIVWLGGDSIIVGGNFETAGGVSANNVALWTGSSWEALGAGTNDEIRALAIDSESVVYAGGFFSRAGGSPASAIARWDGAWHPLGEGVQDDDLRPSVWEITIDGSDVYVGGDFNRAGDSTAVGIARWDGSTWNGVGGGLSGHFGIDDRADDAYAITRHGGQLLVGGFFHVAGTDSIPWLASWSGDQWMPFGGIFDYAVEVILVADPLVYVGGAFNYIDTLKVNNIAAWDGSQWTPLGDGFASQSMWGSAVLDIAVDGDELYAVGGFDSTGSTAVRNVAVWREGMWQALGLGTNHSIGTVAVGQNYVYFGARGMVEVDSISSRGLIAWRKPGTTSVDERRQSGTRLELYPNPFLDETTIDLIAESPTESSVDVIDVLGRTVLTLFRGWVSTGVNRFKLKGTDLAAGIYVIVVETPNGRTTAVAIHR